MAIVNDLKSEVGKIFSSQWTERDGTVVPEDTSLKLDNDGINLDAVVLYADIADSTVLVDSKSPKFAAEVYKSFLHCAAKIIKLRNGTITAYDGDRIMAVYIGNSQNTDAAKTALNINYAVSQIINPAIIAEYGAGTFELKHVVGVDRSKLFVARTGVRGANDLVWVGKAANHAAKMAALPHDFKSYIAKEVYDKMKDEAKLSTDNRNMWEARTWTAMNRTIYASNWRWQP